MDELVALEFGVYAKYNNSILKSLKKAWMTWQQISNMDEFRGIFHNFAKLGKAPILERQLNFVKL